MNNSFSGIFTSIYGQNRLRCMRFWAVAALAMYAFFTTGCANIQAPVGGVKDTIPPVLVKALPAENSRNVTTNELRFAFDEYVTLQNLNENLIINPPQEKFPTITSKLRNVSVKLLDTMQPNTTYTINFGNAIRDVNESNPFKNFSYSFSTGPMIDSLELSGKLVNAETGMPDSTLLVMLHVSETDSAVAKQKPRFATRPNGKGVFHFDHLPVGKFYIFALRDEGNRRYTSLQTPFAFYDTTVTAGEPDSILLRHFVAEKEPERKKTSSSISTGRNKNTEKKLQYTNSSNGGQELEEPLVITFQQKLAAIDSAKIRLTDTAFNNIPIQWVLDTTSTLITIRYNWKPGENYRLVLQRGFARDSTGLTTTRSDTIKFKAKEESDYGSLKLKFTGVNFEQNPVLQFADQSGNAISFTAPLANAEFNYKLFKPGQYKLRILYDANKNGKWDTGDYWKKLQPEMVIPVEQPINVKANWENEIEITL